MRPDPPRTPQTSGAEHLVEVSDVLTKNRESEAEQIAGSMRMKHPTRSTTADGAVGKCAAEAPQFFFLINLHRKHVAVDAAGVGGEDSEAAVAKLVAPLGQYMDSLRLVSIEMANARCCVGVRSSALGLCRDESAAWLLWVRVRADMIFFKAKHLLGHAGKRDAGEQSNARRRALGADIPF